MRDERLKVDKSAIADLDCQPVDSGVDDAILIVRLLAVVDATGEGELRVKVDNPPIILDEGVGSIGSHVDILTGLSDSSSSLEKACGAINLIAISNTSGQHIKKHVVSGVIKLTLNVS